MAKNKFDNAVSEVMQEQAPILDSVADDVAAMQAELGEPTPTANSEPTQPDIPTADVLTAVMVPMFATLCPNWNVTNEECSNVAQAWGPVLDKYLPDWVTRFGVEVNAVLITLLVFGPRWSTPRKIVDVKKEPEQTTGAAVAT